jgi:2-phosphosulfolactate phosphatase
VPHDPLFNQHPHRMRLDWGRRGVRDAADRGDVIVIVDVLRFSSCVAAAVERGASVAPCAFDAEAADLAQRLGARVANAPEGSRAGFALVPTFTEARAGETIVLRTLNGAECTLLASGAPRVFAGSLLNASPVANAVAKSVDTSDLCVTVVACGERWSHPMPGEEISFAIEDYLGAGAILSEIGGDLSAEALVCAAAFERSRERLLELLLDCGSGRQLVAWGLEADVRYAAQLDACTTVPVLRDGRYERFDT